VTHTQNLNIKLSATQYLVANIALRNAGIIVKYRKFTFYQKILFVNQSITFVGIQLYCHLDSKDSFLFNTIINNILKINDPILQIIDFSNVK